MRFHGGGIGLVEPCTAVSGTAGSSEAHHFLNANLEANPPCGSERQDNAPWGNDDNVDPDVARDDGEVLEVGDRLSPNNGDIDNDAGGSDDGGHRDLGNSDEDGDEVDRGGGEGSESVDEDWMTKIWNQMATMVLAMTMRVG